MWTIGTAWFDVATFMSLYVVGVILFGHFEFHKPRGAACSRQRCSLPCSCRSFTALGALSRGLDADL
jgi:hypothetical protein